jgi:excisionase family DNA binding protein
VSELPATALDTLLERLAESLARKLADRLAAEQGKQGDEEASPWLALESAARYLDWPKQRLYKLVASGAVPHYKQEGRLLFHREELDRWLAQFAQGERASLLLRERANVVSRSNDGMNERRASDA